MTLFKKKLHKSTQTHIKKQCEYCLKEGKGYYRCVFEQEGEIKHFCSRYCVDQYKKIIDAARILENLQLEQFNYQMDDSHK